MIKQQGCLPHDTVNTILQKVVVAYGVPVCGDSALSVTLLQLLHGLFLILCDLTGIACLCIDIRGQRQECRPVQLSQQGSFPAVPAFWVGGAHIGDCQQVEVVEAFRCLHLPGEFMDDRWIFNILALGGHGHHKMRAHQPCNQTALFLIESVLAAKIIGHHLAKL